MSRSMKNVLRIAAIVVSCMMLMSVFAVQNKVKAADTETTYTVRILPGAKGTAQTQVYTGKHYGETITVYVDSTAVNDDRYYAKGLKDSGMDNNDPVSDFYYDPSNPYLVNAGGGNWVITVTKDQDFVISYGLKSSIVEYTVNYVSTTGATLAPSETYYGSVGDQPVVSYLYIEGYEPTSNNVTTLQAGSNVFTYTYTQIVVPAAVTPAATPAAEGAAATPAEGAATPAAEGAAAPAEGAAATPAEGAAATPAEGEATVIPENEVPLAPGNARTYDGFVIADQTTATGLGSEGTGEPDEEGLITIDEPLVPQAAFTGTGANRVEKSRYAVYGADNTVLFAYNYNADEELFTGMTAFPGEAAAYIQK